MHDHRELLGPASRPLAHPPTAAAAAGTRRGCRGRHRPALPRRPRPGARRVRRLDDLRWRRHHPLHRELAAAEQAGRSGLPRGITDRPGSQLAVRHQDRGAGRRARDRPEHDRADRVRHGRFGGAQLRAHARRSVAAVPTTARSTRAARECRAGRPRLPVTTFQTAQANAYPPPAYSPYTRLPDHYEPESAPAGSSTDAATDAGTTSPTPPAWDPLGVAPFAWDLPEPARTAEPPAELPSRPRSRYTSVVLGLAVLAAAAATAMWAVTGAEWLSPARIGAISSR